MDQKKLYCYLRDLNKIRTNSVFVTSEGEFVTDLSRIATCFNEFFHSTFTRSDYVLPDVPAPSTQLSSISIDSSDTFKALASLIHGKAMGCDRVRPRVLKACAMSLCEPISALFTQCLAMCSLPAEWKIHQITLVLKKGDSSLFTNYRPISLLCILSKVLESVVFSKIIDYIRPQINTNQFGFMSKRSSITQLLKCYSEVVNSIDNKTPIDVLYLDLRKAFNSVPHNELLFKLWMMGVTGPLWFWFRNYLSGRLHFVQCKGASSSYLPVISGVQYFGTSAFLSMSMIYLMLFRIQAYTCSLMMLRC